MSYGSSSLAMPRLAFYVTVHVTAFFMIVQLCLGREGFGPLARPGSGPAFLRDLGFTD